MNINNQFAEGSSRNTDKSEPEKLPTIGREHEHLEKFDNISQASDITVNNTKLNNSSHVSLDNSLRKLETNNSDLNLGIPQVDHINGSSSIKPRKGVPPIDAPEHDDASIKSKKGSALSKIVPRKGVNESDNSLPVISTCFIINNNTCFNISKFHQSDCSCCNDTNSKDEVISPEYSVNCSFCKPISNVLADGSLSCNKICCKNVSVDNNKLLKVDSGLSVIVNANNVTNVNQSKNSSKIDLHEKKPKPTITKVPSDIEVVSVAPFHSKKAVVIPIIVSLLILPLISVLAFFLWRRTRDYWDKRHYKRMDFLIDGMYND